MTADVSAKPSQRAVMSTVTIHLPDAVHEKLRNFVERDGISVEQLLALAAQKMAAMTDVEYLEQRAARGSRASLHMILDRVPHVPPDPGDEL